MFESLSYKKKCIALLILFCMLSVTAYKRSFHTLFQAIQENKMLSAKIDAMNSKSHNTSHLMNEIAYLNKAIGKEGIGKERVQQSIVDFATGNAHQISINDLQPIHVFDDNDYKIVSNQLDVTGGANQLLKLGYDFEKEFNYSRMVSMSFYTNKKNNKTEVLHLKMIFQNYENTK